MKVPSLHRMNNKCALVGAILRRGGHPRAIHPNETNRSTRNPPKRNCRGGACVPARTSAQRRFHTENTRIVCRDFNDGCAPAGRHGRAHRRRPYPSPSYFSTQSHTNKIPSMRNSPQTKSTVYTQSSPTISTTQTRRVNKTTHIGGGNASRTPAPLT